MLCHVLCAVVRQTERSNGTSGHQPWQVPGRDTSLGSACWPEICLFLLCTQRTAGAPVELMSRALQSTLNGVVRAAVPSLHGH